MPRKRNGGPGQPNGQPTQPVQVPTGLPYGQNQQLAQSQAAVPLPAQPPPPPAGPARGAPPEPDRHGAAMAAAAAMPGIGGLLAGPSGRPHEPVTAGLSAGLGPGPEVLGQRPSTQAAFRSLADQTADPDLAYLADIVGQLGL